jgi:hypothetical protein
MEYCNGKVDHRDNNEICQMLPLIETFDTLVTSTYLSVAYLYQM